MLHQKVPKMAFWWTWLHFWQFLFRGHTLSRDVRDIAWKALTWTLEGRRKRLSPKEMYTRTVEREREQLGLHSWSAAGAIAKDRAAEKNIQNRKNFSPGKNICTREVCILNKSPPYFCRSTYPRKLLTVFLRFLISLVYCFCQVCWCVSCP